MTSVLTQKIVVLEDRLHATYNHSNRMAYRPSIHLNMDNNNQPSKVSNAMQYRGQQREAPASPPPADYGGYNDDSPPGSPQLPRFDYNNDRIQNDLLQEICSDIGIKDAMDLDFYDFDTNMFTDKRESYGSDGDVLDQVIPFSHLQQQEEVSQRTDNYDIGESVSQACSTAPSAQVSPARPGSADSEHNLICFKDENGPSDEPDQKETVVASPSEATVSTQIPTITSSVASPAPEDMKYKAGSPYPQSPAVSVKSAASPVPTLGPPSNQSQIMGPPSNGPPSLEPPSNQSQIMGPPSNQSQIMGPPSNQSVRSYTSGPPSNQSVHEVPPSPSQEPPTVQSSQGAQSHPQSSQTVNRAVSSDQPSKFVLTGVPSNGPMPPGNVAVRRGRNLESPFDQGYYSVGSGSMYTGSHYGSSTDLASTGDTPPLSTSDNLEHFLTTNVASTTDSHGGPATHHGAPATHHGAPHGQVAHSTPLPKGQGILPPNSQYPQVQPNVPNRAGKNVSFAMPNTEGRDFNAYGKRPSEAQLTPRPEGWDSRTPDGPQGLYQVRMKTGSQPSSPKKAKMSYTPDVLSPSRRTSLPKTEAGEPPFDPTLFPSHQGLMKHLIADRSSAFRSHPFFPLLRDLIIADMNFFAPTFPFALIANLPPDFDRLMQNYKHRNPTLANSPRVNQAVETVFMDALRYAHKSLIEKIMGRKKQEGDGPKTSSAIEEFCDRFDRAVKNTAASQGVNVKEGMIGQPQVGVPGQSVVPSTSVHGQYKTPSGERTRPSYAPPMPASSRYQGNPPGGQGMFQPNQSVPSEFNFQNQMKRSLQHPQQQHPQPQHSQQQHSQQQRHPGYETPPPAMQSYQSQYPPGLQRQGSSPYHRRSNQYGQGQMTGQISQGQMPQGQMHGQMPEQMMPHMQSQRTPNGPHMHHGQMPGTGQVLTHHGQMSGTGQVPTHQGQMLGPGQMPNRTMPGQVAHMGQMSGQGQMQMRGQGHAAQMSKPGQVPGYTPQYQHSHMQYTQHSMPHNNMIQPDVYSMEPNLASQTMLSKSMNCLQGQYGHSNPPGQGGVYRPQSSPDLPRHVAMSMHRPPSAGGYQDFTESRSLTPQHRSLSQNLGPGLNQGPQGGQGQLGTPQGHMGGTQLPPQGPQGQLGFQGQMGPQMNQMPYSHKQYYQDCKSGAMNAPQQVQLPSNNVPGGYYDVQSGDEDSRPDTPSDRSSNSSKKQVLPKEAVSVMLDWLKDHQHNPYPNETEKETLINMTGLSLSQINHWFTNARRRILPKWLLQRLLEEQAVASGEDPSKVRVTGSAHDIRQIAKDMLQGKAPLYLSRPSESASPSSPGGAGSPLAVLSPLIWPYGEETKNYSNPPTGHFPFSGVPFGGPNDSSMPEYLISQPVFQNYQDYSQNAYNHTTVATGELISLDTYGQTIDFKLDDMSGNYPSQINIEKPSSDVLQNSDSNLSVDSNEAKSTTLSDLSFLFS